MHHPVEFCFSHFLLVFVEVDDGTDVSDGEVFFLFDGFSFCFLVNFLEENEIVFFLVKSCEAEELLIFLIGPCYQVLEL